MEGWKERKKEREKGEKDSVNVHVLSTRSSICISFLGSCLILLLVCRMAVRHQPGTHGHQFQTPHWVRNQQPGSEAGSIASLSFFSMKHILFLILGDWMPKPPSISDVPEGLEYLGLVDQILIKQVYTSQ